MAPATLTVINITSTLLMIGCYLTLSGTKAVQAGFFFLPKFFEKLAFKWSIQPIKCGAFNLDCDVLKQTK